MKLKDGIRVAMLLLVSCKFEASCGGNTLNMDKARDFVATTLEKDVGEKPTVTCPASVKAETGATFDCTAAFGDVKSTITLKQNDDKGNVTIVSNTGLVVSAKMEQTIADGLKEQLHGDFKVNCGPRVHASTPNDHFTCDAAQVGGTGRGGKIAVTVKDANGNVSWEAQDAPPPPAAAPTPSP